MKNYKIKTDRRTALLWACAEFGIKNGYNYYFKKIEKNGFFVDKTCSGIFFRALEKRKTAETFAARIRESAACNHGRIGGDTRDCMKASVL